MISKRHQLIKTRNVAINHSGTQHRLRAFCFGGERGIKLRLNPGVGGDKAKIPRFARPFF